MARLPRTLDAYGEFRNPEQHPQITALLASGALGDYHDSQSYIRGERPTAGHHVEASHFWRAPLSRAHLINALLRRGGRSVVEVERDLLLSPGSIYKYFSVWRIMFAARPQRHVGVMDYDGGGELIYEGEVVEHLPQPGHARLRVLGFPGRVVGVWSAANHCYRLLESLPQPQGMLPLARAAHYLGVSVDHLRQALRWAGCAQNGQVYLADLVRMCESSEAWLAHAMSEVEAAL